MFPKTVEWLTGCARWIADRHPSDAPDVEFVSYGLASEYLRAYIDNDWTNQMFFGQHLEIGRSNRAGRKFLRAESVAPDEQYQNQQRMVRLAELLFNLQGVEGVGAKRAELLSGNVEPTFSELETGGFLLQRSLPFCYVVPTGMKGSDYDIEIKLIGYSKLNCEIKCKIEGTEPSEGAVRNPLQTARKQLPAGEPGIIFLKLPESWIVDPRTYPMVSDTIGDFLSRTRRVAAVILRWEELKMHDPANGAAFHYKYRVERINPARSEDPSVAAVLQKLNGPGVATWVSFMQVANEMLQQKYMGQE